ncbi:DUF4179 domain-containing protein [Bacillus niameyensis]|uniref:DUF4179 domain-containing protein n=1 Tax=Bacillus niameyensis TaxID=1522308 RepID=UPI0007828315|nr:DUF4179 domain-containing protein [Bacillus niameyensis]
MDKVSFNVITENIDVPEDELFLRINNGIEKGKKSKNRKRKAKMLVPMASMAASLLLISGFLFAPMTKVLANVPVIGLIYESFQMSIGKDLEEKNLLTPLNETVSDNGVQITLTSAYYDGLYMGISFKAEEEGEISKIKNDMVIDYDFYLFNDQGWSGSIGDLQKVDDHFVSFIEIEYPDKQLPTDYTLPITFTNMGGVEGSWSFEVPVTQLPLKTFTFENSKTEDENYSFTVESIVSGTSNMRVDYTTNIPEDLLTLRILDHKGKELSDHTHLHHGSDSAVFQTGINDSNKYLIIYPGYRMDGKFIELEPLKVSVQE